MSTPVATTTPGQGRALWMSTIAFTVCFAVWTIFAIIGVQFKQQLNLNETVFGLLVGTPLLTGSLIRLALGIFGAGNVGAAATKSVAPFVLVAYGWQVTAQVWAAGIAIMAVVCWFTTTDDPVLRARRARGETATSAWLELAPLKNIQVWRFSLYYFFVFGAFVALSLWLPRYLIAVYGVDIKTAGMAAAMFSLPASLFRVYCGHLSDRYGARRVMYWTFMVSVVC